VLDTDQNFRGLDAVDSRTALVTGASLTDGGDAKVYRTTDGGRTWAETFRNTEKAAFYNCMDFYPGGRRGLAVSDPVDGRFRIAATKDSGRSWSVLSDADMPDSTGEFNFSASGDCLVISGQRAYFGRGAPPPASSAPPTAVALGPVPAT
jgi:photosystem II stability/assembly factor-like uncharacterized protein